MRGCGSLPGIVQRRSGDTVDTAQPLGQGPHGFLGAGVIILFQPTGFQVLVQNGAQHADGQLGLQPGAPGQIVGILAGDKQQQHAVVLVGGAQAPGVEYVIGIPFQGGVADVLGGVHADLGTAGVLQGHRQILHISFRLGGEDVRIVIDGGILVQFRGSQHRRGGQHQAAQRREHRRPPAQVGNDSVFHGSLPVVFIIRWQAQRLSVPPHPTARPVRWPGKIRSRRCRRRLPHYKQPQPAGSPPGRR